MYPKSQIIHRCSILKYPAYPHGPWRFGKPHMELPGRCLCPRLQVEQCSTLPCALLFPEVFLGKMEARKHQKAHFIRGKDSGVLHISQHQSLKCTSSNATWKHMETTPNSAISRWIYQFSVASISLSLLSLLSDMELGTLRSQVQCWIRCNSNRDKPWYVCKT